MQSVIQEVRHALAAAESRAFLRRGPGFARRAEAVEFLDTHVLDRLEFLGENASLPGALQVLGAQARELRQRLDSANGRVVQRLREQVAAGRYTPEALRSTLIRHAGPPGSPGSYDGLDLLAGGLLGGSAPAEPTAVREPEMVGYQPTPARAILDLLERAEIRRDDVFCDVGSGLGQVVILVALLSGARGWGVELEPAYCDYAWQSARRLKVPDVEFIHADARVAPLAGGTVYFLYTPFRRALLRQVLGRLEAEAGARPIRVCTLGPCTVEVAGTHWLMPADGRELHEHQVAVFRSR